MGCAELKKMKVLVGFLISSGGSTEEFHFLDFSRF
jgi:hypothetical protein